MIGTERLREIERQRDRERERDTARQTDRDRQTERQTEKQTETDREERLGVKEYLACLKHADDELDPPDCTQVTHDARNLTFYSSISPCSFKAHSFPSSHGLSTSCTLLYGHVSLFNPKNLGALYHIEISPPPTSPQTSPTDDSSCVVTVVFLYSSLLPHQINHRCSIRLY